MPSDQLSAVEMLNELINQGYITPVAENAHLMMPTAYRSVPTFTTSGTAVVSSEPEGGDDAELDGGTEGDITS